MLGPGGAQPPATLVASVAIIDIPGATSDPLFMQGAQSGGSSAWCVVAGLLRRRGEVLEGVDNVSRSRRFGLMVNFTLVSAVLLVSLTLMLLVLPVVLPPLPPPPPFLMLVPVVIFILLMLIAFVPSGFNAIFVSYLSQLNYGVLKRSDGGKVGQYVADSFASNSNRSDSQLHQLANFNEIC